MQVKLVRSANANGETISYLTFGKSYQVLGIECDDFRLLDDTGNPYLFPPEWFEVMEAAWPTFWICRVEDETEYCCPPEWNAPGFFEDYFDGVPAARQTFQQVYEVRYPNEN